MDEAEILAALQQAVTAAVAASDDAALPVSYIDMPFAVPNDQKWLEIVWIPNNRIGDFWGDSKNHQGLLRLILHWPKSGEAAYEPLNLLGSIGVYFHNGRLLSGVQIYERPDYTGTVDGEDDMLYPISIRYQSYRS